MAYPRVILATQQEINGTQRKLAWFKRAPPDLRKKACMPENILSLMR